LFLLLRRSLSTMPQSALELFRDACGLRAPLALECQGASRTIEGFDTQQLDYPFAIIGRDPRSDLVLHGAEVSRLHAFFQVVEGRIFCIDLNSRTQLRWEGETERRAHGWLDPGGTVWIGPHGIRQAGTDLTQNHAAQCPDPLAFRASDTKDAHQLPRAGLDCQSDSAREISSGGWIAGSPWSVAPSRARSCFVMQAFRGSMPRCCVPRRECGSLIYSHARGL